MAETTGLTYIEVAEFVATFARRSSPIGVEVAAELAGGHIVWRGNSEYPNGVLIIRDMPGAARVIC